MRKNRTKEILASGGRAIGMAVIAIRTPEVVRLLGAAGFDYIFIDTEHGSFDMERVSDLCAATIESGATPIVRVADLQYALIARTLDAGAQGLIFPRVEDPVLLREAISWTKYPPLGRRGFGVAPQMIGYEAAGMPEIISHLNAETMVVVQFETVTALERSEELLSIEGVDVAMIGPADLSISLGIPGEFEHPLLIDTIDRFIAACMRHGVVPGIQTRGVDMAQPWIERGMRLIGCGGEITLLMERSAEVLKIMRKD